MAVSGEIHLKFPEKTSLAQEHPEEAEDIDPAQERGRKYLLQFSPTQTTQQTGRHKLQAL